MKSTPNNTPDSYQTCLSKSFDSWYREGRDVWSKEQEMRGFIDYVLEGSVYPRGALALDIGAGRGADSCYLLERHFEVFAIDLFKLPDWDQIEKKYAGRINFIEHDFSKWQSEERKFTLAIDNGCLHHQHPAALADYLKKIYDCLEPEGIFAMNVFCDPSYSSFQTLTLGDGRLVHVYDEESLRQALAEAQFKTTRLQRVERKNSSFNYNYLYAIATK